MFRWLRRLALIGLLLGLHGVQAAPAGIVLADDASRIEAWPSVTVLPDPGRELDVGSAIGQARRFEPPRSAYATLGLRKEPVWLRIPFETPAGAKALWVLDIDYAVLNRVDVYLVREGQVVQQARLGNMQPFSQRPVQTRSHAVALELKPGTGHELYLRVETLGAMILPITFMRPSTFHAEALGEQMLQGLLTGLALCLVIYSLVQWVSTREPMFVKYAVLSFGSLMFSVVQFGIGGMYLWRDMAWPEQHGAGLSALLASGATFLFVEEVLRGPAMNRYFSRIMFAGAAALGATALAFALDLIHVHTVSTVIGTLGLLPALMGLPGAVRRARDGDAIGWYFLAAWLGYFVTTATMVGVIKGYVDATPWTLHSFQAGATLDMLLFMRVLGLRSKALRLAAENARTERDTLHWLAHTDPLTNLPNRRGMQEALSNALRLCCHEQQLAVYLLDLDGFKPVNDEHGHDVGDELLVAVARRLQGHVRATDLVARLGGDEFVVVASALESPAQAHDLANKLLDAFHAPFTLSSTKVQVGLTIGYALAPLDAYDATSLLKLADAAMYQGKQNGKFRVQRSTEQLAMP